MNKICLIFFVLVSACGPAQNKDYTISMEGLGALKLGMTQAKVEELMKKKIAMTTNYLDTVNGSNRDTAKLVYKNIAVQLEFEKSYYAPYKFHMRLIGIRSSSPLCKTVNGNGVGADRLKIITDYDNYHVKIQPGYANYYQTEKGQGKSTLSVLDDAASTLDNFSDAYTMAFYLMNKKVVSFELKAKLKDERD